MNLTVTYSGKLSPAPRELVAIDTAGEVSLVHSGADPLVVRAQIMALKDRLLSMPGEHVEMPVEHQFATGMYMRKLFIKKGTVLVGKIHKQECMNIVASGDISVLTETGSMRCGAGFTVTSPAGIQKLGYAHEDTVFINVFLTDETDIEKLEEALVCESYDALHGVLTIEGSSL